MKKFWRSGMIDKKVVKTREQEEYINKLHRTILELRREPAEPEPCCVKHHNGIPYIPVELSNEERDDYWLAQHRRDVANNPLTPAQSAKKWGEGIKVLFTGEYDEVKKGNGEVVLDFYKAKQQPKESYTADMLDWMAQHLLDRPYYDNYVNFMRRMEDKQDERKC